MLTCGCMLLVESSGNSQLIDNGQQLAVDDQRIDSEHPCLNSESRGHGQVGQHDYPRG